MRFEYKTRGTCSSKILFDVDDGIVHNLEYIGGCNGNLQGMSRLVEGMNIDDVIARVQGFLSIYIWKKCGLHRSPHFLCLEKQLRAYASGCASFASFSFAIKSACAS